jgi:glycine/D-amino acid oxidase-like deaminating enzyme
VEGAFDVIVVGLGAMGSSTAYHLAKRGAKILGLEAFTPAHEKGHRMGSLGLFGRPTSRTPLMFRSCCGRMSSGIS